MNVAVTDLAWSIVTLHVPVPVHAPDQLANTEVPTSLTALAAATIRAAASETVVPPVYVAAHVAPQLIPAGTEVTIPPPVPARTTVRSKLSLVNVAVTLRAWLMVTVHAPVPVHAPDQPANAETALGVAVSVTTLDAAYDAAQVPPHEMPPSEDVTAPEPGPAIATVSAKVFVTNVALTTFAASIVTVHVAEVPVHAPPQPVKVVVPSGVAVSVTVVPASKTAEHAAPQKMSPGADVTVPAPVRFTVSA